MFLGFLAPGLFLVLLVAVIAVIVAASRRQGDDEEEGPGIGTLKRVFYYFLGFVALGVAAAGLSLLMSTLLGPLFVDKLIVDSGSRLALALALTVVATPIWMYLWARSQHAVVEYPAEARSLGRQFYLHLILGITAAVAAGSVVSILQWSFGINEDPSLAMSVLLIMAGIWFFHWRAARGGGLPNKGISVLMSRLYIYVTALYALVMLAAGTGIVLYRSLLEAYEGVLHTPLLGLDTVQFWSRGMRESLSFAVVGGVWWSAHWLLMARGNQQSGLRQVYLYLFAVFGGALTVVVSTALLLHGTLQWLVGAPGLDAPAEHFRFLPSVIAGLVIGSWLWGYHHAVIKEESTGNEGRFVAARRGYQYLLSAVGLGTLAVGLVIAFGVAIGLLLPGLPTLVPTADWKRLITLAVTSSLWGLPCGVTFGVVSRRKQRPLRLKRGAAPPAASSSMPFSESRCSSRWGT
ncbi:MAG: hypothetical protein HW397_472 [Dehalococcoidia bacterium]|nr:hypothetical protein [Dehalococcoidia bacterium]